MGNLGNFGMPNPAQPLSTSQDDKGNAVQSRISDVWHTFLVRLSQLSAERGIMPVSPGPSPWTYEATTIGNLSVQGGTVSSKVLTRGSVSVSMTGTLLPMAAGDTVTVTYTVAPTVNFIPGARA